MQPIHVINAFAVSVGNLEIQLPFIYQKHSASLGSACALYLRPRQCFCRVVRHLEAKQMGDAQPHAWPDGQCLCLCSDH